MKTPMTKLINTAALAALLLLSISSAKATQDGMIGEVRMFAGNFAPRTWAFCEGQLLPISSYQALFSILGTTYGGDGRTTFALPDLRGRVPVGTGNGPGLSPQRLGQRSGTETSPLGKGDAAVSSGPRPVLGINFIICTVGEFPSRS